MDKEPESETEEKDQTWEDRILCSDESCIGVIGPDGLCKECGRPYEGPLPTASRPQPASASFEDEAAADAPTEEKSTDTDVGFDGEVADEEWQARKLCRDESCIGVIGPDGLCKECGRPYDE